MTSYGSADAAWLAALDFTSQGHHVDCRNGGSREVIGHQFVINKPWRNFVTNERRGLSKRYAAGELFWYLSGSNSLEQISSYAPSYGRFSDDGVVLNGAYGPAIRPGIIQVVRMLKENPNTRRAVIPIYDFTNLSQSSKDIPCTLTLQFILRADSLYLVVNMRSNDVWLGMPYDMFCFMSLQLLVGAYLGVPPGAYFHNVGSLHLYDKDATIAADALEGVYDPIQFDCTNLSSCDLERDLHIWCKAEEFLRDGGSYSYTEPTLNPWSAWLEMLSC